MSETILQMVREEPVGEGARLIHNSLTLPVMAYARSSGLFSMLRDGLHLPMKTVRYTPTEKVVEFMASLVAGCQHTVSINHRLVPDTTLAWECLGKPRFADQSGINRLLRSFTQENLQELEGVYHQYYLRHGLARRHPRNEILIVDLDGVGLKAEGENYEGTSEGYFPGERGAKGYQCSFAYVHGYREGLGFVLGPGNAREVHHMNDILDLVEKRLEGRLPGRILLRGDGAHGTSPYVKEALKRGYLILFKGKLPQSARKYAQYVGEWKPLKDENWGGESTLNRITGCPYPLRVVVFRKAGKDGAWGYWHLITSLPRDGYPVERLMDLYFAREGAEAYVKTDKAGLHLRNLRTRCLNGIRAVLTLTLLTHNLILHALKAMFKPPLRVGVKAFTEKYAPLPAWLIRRGGILRLIFKEPNPLISRYIKKAKRPSLLDYI